MDARAGIVVVALSFALLIGWVAAPLTSPSITPRVTVHGAAAPPTGVSRLATPVAAPTGPVGGRLFQSIQTLPDGDTNSATGVAVDPTTGTVFAANKFAGSITAFNESSGTIEASQRVAEFAAGSFPAGLAIDPSHHRLFVPVSTIYAPGGTGGWLLVLDESTLATLANVSFPGAPLGTFEPTFLAYDAPSGQLFVENATLGEVAAVNLTTDSVSTYLPCPVALCAMHGYGLLDIPAYHLLLLPTCQPQMWFVNTSNDSTAAVVTGPPDTIMAWSTFDTVDNTLWVENYTYYGPTGSFLRYNLSTFTLLGNVVGAPPRGAAIGYDAADNLLIATDLNGSEQISLYDAATANRTASYSGAGGTGHPFTALAFDPRTDVVVASGSGNGTTLAFRLPALTLTRTYASFPVSQVASAADPTLNEAIVLGSQPAT
ncbi:MAG TPA: hypothetical protein VEY07_05610, partial [Thermoplasmata archaeon]|nr:hypothetical protein [Thermoplasmata archaeon]